MSGLLEHSDHRKAGRAVIIISSMYILLDQCTVTFGKISLLGLDVNINSVEFGEILKLALAVYSTIFLIRVYQSGLILKAQEFYGENEMRLESYIGRLETSFSNYEAKITEIYGPFKLRIAGFNADEPESTEIQRARARLRNKKSVKEFFIRLAKVYFLPKSVIDVLMFLLIEISIPIIFVLIAVSESAAFQMCPSFAYSLEYLTELP